MVRLVHRCYCPKNWQDNLIGINMWKDMFIDLIVQMLWQDWFIDLADKKCDSNNNNNNRFAGQGEEHVGKPMKKTEENQCKRTKNEENEGKPMRNQ